MKGLNLILGVMCLLAAVAVFGSASSKGLAGTSNEDIQNATNMMESSMNVMMNEMAYVPVLGEADITATHSGADISGKVKFTETESGLLVEANVLNVPEPGAHGFHIHEVGSCNDAGNAAGGHYNPNNSPHGLLENDGHPKAHAGDMGNIIIDANGSGQLSTFLPEVGLTAGKYQVAGRSVILHEKSDDFGQPTGNAGGRIGCGVIKLTE